MLNNNEETLLDILIDLYMIIIKLFVYYLFHVVFLSQQRKKQNKNEFSIERLFNSISEQDAFLCMNEEKIVLN
jgi:hypothetical protein